MTLNGTWKILSITDPLSGIFGIRKENIVKEKLYIKGDVTQIDQVLGNLFTNARDAMPNGRKMSISVKSIRIKKDKERLLDLSSPGRYVLLAVSDSGIGISESEQRKIFEPSYTTKEPWKGTGLGLSTAYGIVKQHGGSICFKSEANKGTTFYLYFPLTENIQKN